MNISKSSDLAKKKIYKSMFEIENIDVHMKKKNMLNSLKKSATLCQYDYLKESLKKIKVEEPSSEIQLKELINLLNKNKDSGFYVLLQLFLNKYYSIEDSIKIIEYLNKEKNLNDYELYKNIFKYPFKKELKQNKIKIQEYNISKLFNVFEKRYYRYFNIKYDVKINLLKGQANQLKIYEKEKMKNNNYENNILDFNYLDLNFINDEKMELFKDKFLINDNNTYGAYINKPENFKYKYEIINKNGETKYPDNYFDIITCWNFLEKIPNLNSVMKEIKRIIKPNGLLLIYYNVSFNEIDYYLYCLDKVIKYFKKKKFNEKEWNLYIKNESFCRFKNFTNWNSLMYDYDFKEWGYGNYNFSFNYNPNIENLRFIFYINNKN